MKKIFLLVALCAGMAHAKAATWYVDAAATGAADGASWGSAYTTIAAALDAAASGDEVWVKAGSYHIAATLTAKEGVNVYGGFAGTESSPARRVRAAAAPWSFAHASVLDADGAGVRILTSGSLSTRTTWDGFTFQNAAPSATGAAGRGGAAVLGTNMVLANSILQHNTAADEGGAVYMTRDAGLYTSLLRGNSGTAGGAVAIRDGASSGDHLTVHGCHITGNVARTNANGGGAITNYYAAGSSGSFKISSCYIADNAALAGNAAAIFSNAGAPLFMVVEDCVITGHTTAGGGAPAVARGNNGLLLNRCMVTDNHIATAANTGLVFFNNRGAIYSSVLANNSMTGGTQGTALFLNHADAVAIGNTVVNNSVARDLAGNANAKLVNNIVQGNTRSAYLPTGAAQNVFDGVSFRKATPFVGAAATPEQALAVLGADWRPGAPLDTGLNLTGSNAYDSFLGELLLTDFYADPRPATGGWTIGAYSYRSALSANAITWSQPLSLDLLGGAKEVTLTAAATAAGAVRYSVDNPQVAYLEDGNLLRAFAPGATTVRANHGGDVAHAAAAEVALTVTVSGPASTLALSAERLQVPKTASSDGAVTLSSNYGYTTPYRGLWITAVSPASVSEPSTGRTVTLTVAANPSVTERVDSVVFLSGGVRKTLTVVQAAGDPVLSATPTSVPLAALEGASATFAVTSNTAWAISGGAPWASLSAASGSGNATITVTVAQENTDVAAGRSATLTISAAGAPAVQVALEQAPALPATIIYVSQDGDGADGASWATAYRSVAEALSAAVAGNKIFVKTGTYPLAAALRSKAGVRVYGGFAGTETGDGAEATRAKPAGAQPWEFTHPTVLQPAAGVRAIDSTVLATPATWDGFTLQGARHTATAEDSLRVGGAAYLRRNTFLSSCIIRDNVTYAPGGGVYMEVDARLYSSLVERNRVLNPGALDGNGLMAGGGNGGGVHVAPVATGSDYTPLVGNSIVDNIANQGGGIAIVFAAGTYTGTLTLAGCYVARDTSCVENGGGGGVFLTMASVCNVIFDSCTFERNVKVNDPPSGGSAGGAGVRMQGAGGSVFFDRCVFAYNKSAAPSPAIRRGASVIQANNHDPKYRIYNSLVIGNTGAQYVVEVRNNVHLINNTIVGNDPMAIGHGTGTMLNNVVWGNGVDLNPATADPSNVGRVAFADSAARDFRLAVGSPGVDCGRVIAYETDPTGRDMLRKDFAGTPRPQGASYDPGMYEYIKVKPAATIAWAQDVSSFDINAAEQVKLTAVATAPAHEAAYLLPLAYTSDDVLTVSTRGDTLILMGAGATTLTAHTRENPYYDTVAVRKPVTVTGSGYLSATTGAMALGMYPADSVASFKLNTDMDWSIGGIPGWLTLSATSGSAGRAEVWVSVTGDNSLTAPRAATLTITAGGKSRTVVVRQHGLVFSVSANEITLLALGDAQTFDVRANLAWRAGTEADWLTLSPSDGGGDTTVFVTPADNAGATRTATVTVEVDREGVPPLTITVVQAGTPTTPPVTGVGKEALTAFIYPNPTADVLHIALSQDVGSAQLQVLNAAGAVVYAAPWSGVQQRLSMAHLGRGVYFVSIKGANGTVLSAKVLKR